MNSAILRFVAPIVFLSSAAPVLADVHVCNNNGPCTILYVVVRSRIVCPGYETTFTCDHYLANGECLHMYDGPEGSNCWRTHSVQSTALLSAGYVTLSKASSQGYPASDIFPNICVNAQSAYRSAKWVVGGSVHLSPMTVSWSGPIQPDKTTVYKGDTINVTATGAGTGYYTLTVTRQDGCTTTVSGTVFQFVFIGSKTTNYSPAGSVNGAQYNGSQFTVNVPNTSYWIDGGRHADVSNNYRVKVVASPNVFSGNVKAAIRVNTWYKPNAKLIKYIGDDGAGVVGIDVGIPGVSWLNFSLANSGPHNVAAVKHKADYSFGGSSWTAAASGSYDTTSFSVSPLAIYESRVFGGTINLQRDDAEITYSTGTTERTFGLHVGIGGNTSTTSVPPGVSVPTSFTDTNLAGQTGATFSEVNNQFLIQ